MVYLECSLKVDDTNKMMIDKRCQTVTTVITSQVPSFILCVYVGWCGDIIPSIQRDIYMNTNMIS